MSDRSIQFPRVPVIGLQARKVQICGLPVVTAVVLCDCGHPIPVVIANLDRAGFCPACKTKYVIAKLQFQNVNGQVSLAWEVGKWEGPMAASNELTVGIDASPSDGKTM